MKAINTIMLPLSFLLVSCNKQISDKEKSIEVNKIQRSANKLRHRAEEAVCGTITRENKVECLAKKLRNRVIESKYEVVEESIE